VVKNMDNKSKALEFLRIPRASFYYQSILEEKDKKLKTDIENVWVKHLGYGGERLAIELQINEKRIRRVMKKFGLRPPRGRKRPRKSRWNDNGRTYAIGVIPVKLVLAKAGNGNPGR